MSLLDDIQSLEDRIQKELFKAGGYSSITDFVQVYQQSILQALESFTRADLSKTDLESLVGRALSQATDILDEGLAAQIQGSVRTLLNDTAAFYEELGIEPVDLVDGIERRQEIEQLTEEFSINMATMREELREGTIETMTETLAKEGMNRELLAERIFEFADGKAHWARTNARMVVSSSNRIARDELRISADLKHGFYFGEIRTSTRAFCRSCVGKTFTLQQIENMANGQGLDVKIYAGGWNCIHSWLWVDPEWDPELKSTLESERPIVQVSEDSLDLSIPGE